LTIETLAALAGIHPTHLAREFRRYFKTTIGKYVRQKRIEFARQELIASNKEISEIAQASGFFDQSHLTRIFSKATGMTPAAYRTSFRNR
jgi:AraC family transcriptional regulator